MYEGDLNERRREGWCVGFSRVSAADKHVSIGVIVVTKLVGDYALSRNKSIYRVDPRYDMAQVKETSRPIWGQPSLRGKC
jgi:hypothetical protein